MQKREDLLLDCTIQMLNFNVQILFIAILVSRKIIICSQTEQNLQIHMP